MFCWSIWGSLVHQLGRTVNHRTIDNIRVSSNPTYICGTPVDISFRFKIKYSAMGIGRLSEITTSRMKNSFRFCRCSWCVKNEEHMFRIETFRGMYWALSVNNFVPPNITTTSPRNFLPRAFNNKYILHIVIWAWQRLIHNGFEWKCAPFSKSTIRGNHESCICILNTT